MNGASVFGSPPELFRFPAFRSEVLTQIVDNYPEFFVRSGCAELSHLLNGLIPFRSTASSFVGNRIRDNSNRLALPLLDPLPAGEVRPERLAWFSRSRLRWWRRRCRA